MGNSPAEAEEKLQQHLVNDSDGHEENPHEDPASEEPEHDEDSESMRYQCLVCCETLRYDEGLFCSTEEHFVCLGEDCLLKYAECAETLARTKGGRVPCCGATGLGGTGKAKAVECWYGVGDFVECIVAIGGGQLDDDDGADDAAAAPAPMQVDAEGAEVHDHWESHDVEGARGQDNSDTPNDNHTPSEEGAVSAGGAGPRVGEQNQDVGGEDVEEDEGVKKNGQAQAGDDHGELDHDLMFEDGVVETDQELRTRIEKVTRQYLQLDSTRPGQKDHHQQDAATNPKNSTGTEEHDFARFAEGLIENLSLRCPKSICRKVLDPNPDGCAKMKCAHCQVRFCWVCFDHGWDTDLGLYGHLTRHKFTSVDAPYFPSKEEIRDGHNGVRARQLELYLTGADHHEDCGAGKMEATGRSGKPPPKRDAKGTPAPPPTRLQQIQARLLERQQELLDAVQRHVDRNEVDVKALFRTARQKIRTKTAREANARRIGVASTRAGGSGGPASIGNPWIPGVRASNLPSFTELLREGRRPDPAAMKRAAEFETFLAKRNAEMEADMEELRREEADYEDELRRRAATGSSSAGTASRGCGAASSTRPNSMTSERARRVFDDFMAENPDSDEDVGGERQRGLENDGGKETTPTSVVRLRAVLKDRVVAVDEAGTAFIVGKTASERVLKATREERSQVNQFRREARAVWCVTASAGNKNVQRKKWVAQQKLPVKREFCQHNWIPNTGTDEEVTQRIMNLVAASKGRVFIEGGSWLGEKDSVGSKGSVAGSTPNARKRPRSDSAEDEKNEHPSKRQKLHTERSVFGTSAADPVIELPDAARDGQL